MNTENDSMADSDDDLPASTLDEAVRLSRLALDAIEENEAAAYRERRDDLLEPHGYTARIRDEGDGETLVCYPSEWINSEGVVDMTAIEDTSRAEEVHLGGRGEQGDYEAATEDNEKIIDMIHCRYGDPHTANARAFADFMENHYASPIPEANDDQVREFLQEYYPRNVWPTPEQSESVERSLEKVFEIAEEPYPLS